MSPEFNQLGKRIQKMKAHRKVLLKVEKLLRPARLCSPAQPRLPAACVLWHMYRAVYNILM